MIVRPRSLLLGLLVILYLQSGAVGQNVNAPKKCCFSFHTRPIPAADISDYEETDPHCPIAGVIFTTKKGPVCADPGFRWVKRAKDIIDRRTVEDGNAPKKCCFSFYTRPIPVADISQYEETDPHCPRDGVIFTYKRGVRVCLEPDFRSKITKGMLILVDV
ncbi:C-C motif chemokine 13-like [Pygocentrus nattereri]|uniref:C-C motif chemokine 13-like n=1 Tax=Pygocentrus nattereri TaxID=42514 RepID=UPI00081497E0|nr:C-C motif chemokine 13-like [Pygocentrus nattereri]XP_037400712.1 C-C motif chemokine 13-like [Pygocentrus nattereri]